MGYGDQFSMIKTSKKLVVLWCFEDKIRNEKFSQHKPFKLSFQQTLHRKNRFYVSTLPLWRWCIFKVLNAFSCHTLEGRVHLKKFQSKTLSFNQSQTLRRGNSVMFSGRKFVDNCPLFDLVALSYAYSHCVSLTVFFTIYFERIFASKPAKTKKNMGSKFRLTCPTKCRKIRSRPKFR